MIGIWAKCGGKYRLDHHSAMGTAGDIWLIFRLDDKKRRVTESMQRLGRARQTPPLQERKENMGDHHQLEAGPVRCDDRQRRLT